MPKPEPESVSVWGGDGTGRAVIILYFTEDYTRYDERAKKMRQTIGPNENDNKVEKGKSHTENMTKTHKKICYDIFIGTTMMIKLWVKTKTKTPLLQVD